MKRYPRKKRKLLQFVLTLTFLVASHPVFGDVFPYERSTKLLGKSNLELTSHYSALFISGNDFSGHEGINHYLNEGCA